MPGFTVTSYTVHKFLILTVLSLLLTGPLAVGRMLGAQARVEKTLGVQDNIKVEQISIWDARDHGKSRVSLTAYIPAQCSNATAVIVCPGGSYFWLDNKNEGEISALELAKHGIAAFVLNYRVAGKINFITDLRFLYGGNRFPRMLEDLQQAIMHVRSNAGHYGVRPDRIGCMGFSAGGHLVMMAAESEIYQGRVPEYEHPGASAMPNFVAPIYPVVTMTQKDVVHRRSRRALMGVKEGDKGLRAVLSLEQNIPDACCPVFLLNCADDPIVNYRNSELLDNALAAKGIQHKYTQLPFGGHGFGFNDIRRADSLYLWTPSFIEWVSTLCPAE